MYPRQSLTPRCSAKPTRHPAHPDVDPHAVFKRQLPLRLKMMPVRHTGGGGRKRRKHRHRKLPCKCYPKWVKLHWYSTWMQILMLTCPILIQMSSVAPPERAKYLPTIPHIDMITTMLIKTITLKMILMVTFSIRRGKHRFFNYFYTPQFVNF